MKRAGVTGFTGFIGQRLMNYPKLNFTAVPLQLRGSEHGRFECGGFETIIHLAGKAHDMSNPDPQQYFDVNTELTRQLATAAKAQGVSHFIYFSSVKVYGDGDEEYYNESSACTPNDSYGESKYRAEEILREMETASFKISVIRPPLVYGPGVKANMFNLMKLAKRNIPLPFGDQMNKRSMVYIDNLVELVNAVVNRQASGIFIAGDSEPISTKQLVTLIRKKMGMEALLFKMPYFLKSLLKKFKPLVFKRLYGSFVIDNNTTNKVLQFTPPHSTEDGINDMVSWYIQSTKVKDKSAIK